MLAGFLFACDGVEKARGPIIQPKKEATWVRTEKVRTTKEEVFSSKEEMLAEIPINAPLAEKLVTEYSNPIVVKDKDSCLNQLDPLNLRRNVVQKAGGVWHVFERNKGSRPYSSKGMQLDSNINKMIFGLRYLCQTSQGVPLDDLAIKLSKLIKIHGREKAEKILIAGGEHKKEAEKLMNYEELARKLSKRKIDFKMIGSRFNQAIRLINLYEKLSNISIDEKSINIFLSDAITLLKVLNDFIETDQIMVMALTEDTLAPFDHKDQGM